MHTANEDEESGFKIWTSCGDNFVKSSKNNVAICIFTEWRICKLIGKGAKIIHSWRSPKPKELIVLLGFHSILTTIIFIWDHRGFNASFTALPREKSYKKTTIV